MISVLTLISSQDILISSLSIVVLSMNWRQLSTSSFWSLAVCFCILQAIKTGAREGLGMRLLSACVVHFLLELLVSVVLKMKSNLGKKGNFSCTQMGIHLFIQWTYSNLHLRGILPLCYLHLCGILLLRYLHLQFTLTQQHNKVINQLASSKLCIPTCICYNNISCCCFSFFYASYTADSTPWTNIITILGYSYIATWCIWALFPGHSQILSHSCRDEWSGNEARCILLELR